MINKSGGIEYLSSLMLLCLGGILLFYSISVKELKQTRIIAEDSLDTACMSAALIDLDVFGTKQNIVINDIEKAYDIFIDTLVSNMNLNASFEPIMQASFNKVTVHKFNIYNPIDDKLYIYSFDEHGRSEMLSERYDRNERTPDGTLIESATIYADIGMEVTGFFDISKYVHVTSSVDIVENQEENDEE